MARVLQDLAITARFQGNWVRAEALLAAGVPTLERLGDCRSLARVDHERGVMAYERGDLDQAGLFLRASLTSFIAAGDHRGVPGSLEELARVALARHQPARAAQLLGAAASIREQMGAVPPPLELVTRDRTEAQVRATLGVPAFVSAWTAGRTVPLTRLIDDDPPEALEHARA